MAKFAVLVSKASGSTFLKYYDYFVSSGGLVEDWGKNWLIVEAPDENSARAFALNQPYAREDGGLYCRSCGKSKNSCYNFPCDNIALPAYLIERNYSDE